MDEMVLIKVLFLAGLLALSGVMLLLAHAIGRLGEWRDARTGRARPARVERQSVKQVPARGTR
ncbi:MAG TPA: hypothetical protein VK878_00480 [Candidatus Deferrimicrobiaceae bacterium]|nr:hypothetical protein [Candidatus Deferrimicrobiaceae bacterium]